MAHRVRQAALRAAAVATLALVQPTKAQTSSDTTGGMTGAAAPPGCVLTGSPGVRANGLGMLRLGDVAGCPGVRYEVISGLFIDGQPAVRLLPDEDCAAQGAAGVTADGAGVGVAGAGC